MTRNARLCVFVPAVAVFAGMFLAGLFRLPGFGHYRGPYGDVVNAITVPERHITDAVTGVNFDIRGFDTLGEEFIMFTSVMGVLLLLRRLRDETQRDRSDRAPGRKVPPASDATRAFTLGLVGALTLFGLYVVVHGQLTPGGGFQGGVFLATAPVLVYLAGDFQTFVRITSHKLIEATDSAGAAGYAIVGLAALVAGGAFLQNFLPLGETGSVLSGGTIAVIDLCVGAEVAAGFVLLSYSFLEETLLYDLGVDG